MAELAALPSFVTAQLQGNHFQASHFMPKKVHFRTVKRKQFHGQCKILVWFQSHQDCELSATATLKGTHHLKQRALRCHCLGSLANPDNPLTMNWVLVMDQVLLISSALFAYMAGIIPPEKAYPRAKTFTSEQDLATSSSTSSGCATTGADQINLECTWDKVQKKLVDALNAVEQGGNLDSNVIECENSSAKRPLSLHAIAVGPRLRLLLATLQQLRKEVKNIPGSNDVAGKDDWLVVLSGIIRISIQLVCVEWLHGELCMENNSHSKAILTRMFGKLKGDDTVLQNIRKSGKEDLYADLLFLLRFGSLGTRSHYSSKLLIQNGIGISEDLLITLADGISSMYLELISVDSTISDEMNSLGLVLCPLSSRELQRLRNEVTFNQWLHQNIESVISMYEDRFDLCTLCTLPVKEPEMSQMEKLDWWKKFTLKKTAAIPSSSCYVVISQLPLPVKRTKELRALTGWRYYFSLFLELSDITMPFLRSLFAKVSDAVSFFLVCLIGRSLGLIYRGIRQSLGWK